MHASSSSVSRQEENFVSRMFQPHPFRLITRFGVTTVLVLLLFGGINTDLVQAAAATPSSPPATTTAMFLTCARTVPTVLTTRHSVVSPSHLDGTSRCGIFHCGIIRNRTRRNLPWNRRAFSSINAKPGHADESTTTTILFIWFDIMTRLGHVP